MRIYAIDYKSVYPEDDTDNDDLGRATDVFNASGIRPSRGKDISDLALSNGKVIGATMSEWEHTGDECYFSFDVAVKSEFRGMYMVGPRLIERAIQKFENERREYEDMSGNGTAMRLEVVNIALPDYLVRRYGFEIERQLPNLVIMVKR